MADMIAEEAGVKAFAFNVKNGVPWHKFGQPMAGLQTVDAMLVAAQADFEVKKAPTAIWDEVAGEWVPVPERYATARIRPDGTLQPFDIVKERYWLIQNRAAAEKALAVVEASNGDAVIETMGCLHDFRRFFVTIDMGGLVIDPLGVADEIQRYLLCSTSHDGTTPLMFAQTDIRVVCANTERMALRGARAVFTAKHTPNVESRVEEAQQVLGISTAWAKAFKAEAEKMLAIPMTPALLETKVLAKMWNPDLADTDRKKANRAEIVGAIQNLFAGPNNAKRVGENGWAAYNAVTEYLDHYSGGKELARATATMDTESLLTRKKIQAHGLVMALAN